MTKGFSVHHAFIALAAGLIVLGASRPAVAEAGACHDLVGTYLTKNFAKGHSAGSFTRRSLVALSGSGQASFTDSGEGGEAGGFDWRCGLCVEQPQVATILVG